MTGKARQPPDDPQAELEETADLLARARAGDTDALNLLFARYVPRLRRWASGRLPRSARDLAETHDLVQDTLLEVFKRIDGFEYRGEGAFLGYLRQALMNRVRNEIRRASRRPDHSVVAPELEDRSTSPFEAAIGAETADRYERGLQRLAAGEREAVIARVELGLSYAEIAALTGKSSPDAARMSVARALVRLSEEMHRDV